MTDGSAKSSSFLSPQLRGGVVGAKGYSYQEAYLVTQIPIWLKNPGFQCVVLEGAGDVDVRFLLDGRDERWYIQVRDHHVTPSEFREVVSAFSRMDTESPGTFTHFILACPSVSKDIEGLRQAIEEYRGLIGMYDPNKEPVMRNTLAAIQTLVGNLRLPDSVDFLTDKVHFDSKLPPLNATSVEGELFRARLHELEQWQNAGHLALTSAFGDLVILIRHSLRRAVHRAGIETCIRSAIERAPSSSEEPAVTIYLHNWTTEQYESEPDYVIDWTDHFDRRCRKVPSASIWVNELAPELVKVKEDVLRSGNPKLIRLRGKACLSAGLASGHEFPEVGGYVVEVEQRGQIWRSDTPQASDYHAEVMTDRGNDGLSKDLVVVVSVTGDAGPQVEDYIAAERWRYRAMVTIRPPGGGSDLSIATSAQATSLASQVKAAIRNAQNDYRACGVIHLFLLCPLGLAVFLGQKLTSLGTLQCYEFQDPGYVPSCLLRT